MIESIQRIKLLFHTESIRIGAQLYLLDFYNGLGFIRASEIYLEDNIPHIEMLINPK